MNALWKNVRYGMRVLAKSPAFTLVAVLTLALGIGANAAIFSVVYAALLRPLPYYQPDRLVTLGEGRTQTRDNELVSRNSSYPDFVDWKKSAKSFASLTAYSFDTFTLAGNGEPKSVFAIQAMPNFFATLGVKPALGRGFVDGEDVSDGPHVVMLTYGYWRSDFGGDPDVIGRTITLDNKPVTIVGVLPRDFQFAPSNGFPLWVPMHATQDLLTRRNLRWMNVFARLESGVGTAQAQAEMDGITAQLAREYPQQDGSVFVAIGSLRHRIVGQVQPLLLVIFGAVGFVLLIACANVANLMMTRAAVRRREFAIRTALGASRGQLIAQLLTESLLLAGLGAVVGFVAAQWGVNLLIDAIPQTVLSTLPNLREAGANLPVLAFLCGVTLLTAVLFGLAPALSMSQTKVSDTLKDESRGGTSTAHARLRNAVVAAEIAVSLVLLVGALLFVRSYRNLINIDPGFRESGITVAGFGYPEEKIKPENEAAFKRQLLEDVRIVPGVQNAAETTNVLLSGSTWTHGVRIGGVDGSSRFTYASPSYFATMGIPVITGRGFAATDRADSPYVLIVNQAFVRKYFGDKQPLGQLVQVMPEPQYPARTYEVVGTIADTKYNDLRKELEPMAFVPIDQLPVTVQGPGTQMVIASNDGAGAVAAIRRKIATEHPDMILQFRDFQQGIRDNLVGDRMMAMLSGFFGVLAALLVVVGLYGVLSYFITQRRNEIGVRIALGAQRWQVIGLVMRDTASMLVIGVVLGTALALIAGRAATTMLFGLKPYDIATLIFAIVLLAAIAVLASWLPALKASRLNPVDALRCD